MCCLRVCVCRSIELHSVLCWRGVNVNIPRAFPRLFAKRFLPSFNSHVQIFTCEPVSSLAPSSRQPEVLVIFPHIRFTYGRCRTWYPHRYECDYATSPDWWVSTTSLANLQFVLCIASSWQAAMMISSSANEVHGQNHFCPLFALLVHSLSRDSNWCIYDFKLHFEFSRCQCTSVG